jgi:hypothetical protein
MDWWRHSNLRRTHAALLGIVPWCPDIYLVNVQARSLETRRCLALSFLGAGDDVIAANTSQNSVSVFWTGPQPSLRGGEMVLGE